MPEEISPPVLYHVVYRTVKTIESALPAICVGTFAFMWGGWAPGLIGTSLAILDLTAQHYGLYHRGHLSAGTMGYVLLERVDIAPLSVLFGNIIFGPPQAYLAHSEYAFIESVSDRSFIHITLVVTRGIFGFVGGMVMTNMELVGENIQTVTTTAFTVLNGGIQAGPPGAALGLVAGITDIVLSARNVTHKNWLTSAVQGGAVFSLSVPLTLEWTAWSLPASFQRSKSLLTFATFFIRNNVVVGALSGGLIMTIWNVFSEEPETKPGTLMLQVCSDANAIYDKIIPTDQLNMLLSRHYTVALSIQLIMQLASVSVSAHRQQVQIAAYDKKWDQFFRHYRATPKPLLGYIIGFLVKSIISKYFLTKLRYHIMDSIRLNLFDGENFLKLKKELGAEKADIASKGLSADAIAILVCTSMSTEASSARLAAIHASLHLYSINAADMIVMTVIYNAITRSVSVLIATHKTIHTQNISGLKTQEGSWADYIVTNIMSLVTEDRMEFVGQKSNQTEVGLRIFMEASEVWGCVSEAWEMFMGWSNFLVNYLIAGVKVMTGTLIVENYLTATWLTDDVLTLLRLEGKHAASLLEVNVSITRLTELVSVLQNPGRVDAVAVHYGDNHVVRRVVIPSNDIPYVCFSNLKIGVGLKSNVLTKTNLTCIQGHTVGITGDSGAGKSTALLVVKGVKYGPAWGDGTIIFGGFSNKLSYVGQPEPIAMIGYHTHWPSGYGVKDNLRVLMMSQSSSVPSSSNLTYLEYVTSCTGDESQLHRDMVITLARELRFDAGSNMSIVDSLDDNTASRPLSGGQMKKFGLMHAVIKGCGDVLLLDEPFTGLDPTSVQLAQNVLKRYCPNTMLLVVDHDVQHHNDSGFYVGQLHFSNVTKTIQAIVGSYEPEKLRCHAPEDFSCPEPEHRACPTLTGVNEATLCT